MDMIVVMSSIFTKVTPLMSFTIFPSLAQTFCVHKIIFVTKEPTQKRNSKQIIQILIMPEQNSNFSNEQSPQFQHANDDIVQQQHVSRSRTSRHSQVLNEFVTSFQNEENLFELEDPLLENTTSFENSYMDFGIFDSTRLSRCKRVVSLDDDDAVNAGKESGSNLKDEVGGFLPVMSVAAPRRSGVRRGYQDSPKTIRVPTTSGSLSNNCENPLNSNTRSARAA